MTEFHTLASGSGGNAALLTCSGTRVLIDMGLSCRRLETALAALGASLSGLDAILITHEHTDHVAGLPVYVKRGTAPVICTPGTARELCRAVAGIDRLLRPLPMGETAALGAVEVTPWPTSHDCGESAAFLLRTADGTVGYLTDTGAIPGETERALRGAGLLVLESNHDVEKLIAGPYPMALKKRILGPRGHLSNEDAAAFAAESVRAGTRAILLAHLSRENNTPELALKTVGDALRSRSCGVRLAAAPRDALSEGFVLGEAAPCAV